MFTLNGLAELCLSMLTTCQDFVMLGIFSTDPLEKEFGKLQQGSEVAYFLPVQEFVEKLNIKKAVTDIEFG